MSSLKDIRTGFLDYFKDRDHEIVASGPLVPQNDPTLMFTNSGMVPFKNVFIGAETRPYSRAASAQKCVRAGGKHNDLDNVGYTDRHLTFFEMLGNFSFGDYFKEEAISYAWEFVGKDLGLTKDRLMVTVYEDDDEAETLWRKIAGFGDDKIVRLTEDNFWSMGDTGPCGPSSELFFDHGDKIFGGPPGSPEQDGERFVEFWNLVFMQFDQVTSDVRQDLPKLSIDTGMGLERIGTILQGVHTIYETDLFQNLILASADLSDTRPDGNRAASHRVISDHLRSTCFLMADGVLPSNEGRGYVLRRIMRRAMRHAHILGVSDPLMHRLVPTLIHEMGEAYPELVRAQSLMSETLRLEEERFRQTLDRGLKLLDEATAGMDEGDELSGDVAFKLYDTYGFPVDLTEDALRERSMSVDSAGFDAAMDRQKAEARAAWKGSGEAATDEKWFDLRDRFGATEFLGYETEQAEGLVTAILIDGKEVQSASKGDEIVFLTNQTPFYGESGGQVGDRGVAKQGSTTLNVTDTVKKLGDVHGHIAKISKGSFSVGEPVELIVDHDKRMVTRANHSATHLLHAALRNVLGDHVMQKGSLVDDERLRFDFSHSKGLTPEEVERIEAEVNTLLRRNDKVETRLMTPDEAIEQGAMALFGEKYGDEVRVLSMGRDAGEIYSVELCGGTHVNRLGDIGMIKVLGDSAVSAGVRRIEAVTGEGARVFLNAQEALLKQSANALKTAPAELPERIAALVAERKKMDRELADARKALALAGDGGGSAGPSEEDVGGVKFIGQVLTGVSPKDLPGVVDEAKSKLGSGIIAFTCVNDGKAAVAVGVTSDLTDKFSAVDFVKVGVEAVGGKGGGGRPDMARGGGPNGADADKAIEAVKAALAGS